MITDSDFRHISAHSVRAQSLFQEESHNVNEVRKHQSFVMGQENRILRF